MGIPVIIVGIYLAVILFIGFTMRNKSSSLDDYFVGGRSFTLWYNVNTMAATAIGSGTTLGVAGMAYADGISAGWILVGYSIGFCLIAILIAKRMYRLNSVTMPDVIESRFGKRTRWLSSILVMIQYVGIAAAQVLSLGILAESLFGISFTAGLLITGGVMILYTVMGGLFAISLIDVFQMILISFGVMVILPFVGLKEVGGVNNLMEALPADFFNPMSIGIIGLIGILCWIIPQGFLSQELWIRVFASKNESIAKRSTLISSVFIYLPYMVSVLVIGLCGAVLFPGISADSVIPHMITSLTNPYVQGFLFAALLSVVMSTATSVILVAGSNLVKDVYLNIKGSERTSQREILFVSKIGVLIVGIIAILLALSAKGIISLMQNVATPYVGALFPIILALFFWKRATSTGAFATLIVSIIVSLFIFIANPELYGIHPIVINLVLCTITMVVFSLLTFKKKPVQNTHVDNVGS